jgi:hypothetical protein
VRNRKSKPAQDAALEHGAPFGALQVSTAHISRTVKGTEHFWKITVLWPQYCNEESVNCERYGTLQEKNFIVGPVLLEKNVNCKSYGTLPERRFIHYSQGMACDVNKMFFLSTWNTNTLLTLFWPF